MDKKIIKITIDGIEKTGCISDGYHTFDELYDHRITLFIALCRLYFITFYMNSRMERANALLWRSEKHHDGTRFIGYFILGISPVQGGGDITYHLPMERWEETGFAETLESAPEWDGHTAEDVLERLKKL